MPLLMAVFLPGLAYADGSAYGSANLRTSVKAINGVKFAKITGTVKDNAGVPLPGVLVKVKGGTLSAVTNVNGVYTLNLPVGNETLVFSYLGFKTKEVSASGQTNMTVVLEEEISKLDEVVVIGYGTVKKKDLTGAVASVKAEEIMRTPTSNVMDAMQSKVSGMEVMKSSGRAGSGVNVTVRGQRSLSGNSTPLYIIDGIPGDFSQLNPSDIETIDVAKDASATAIYGSAGANGVVFITTKKGKEGKLR